jgi:hypothetical protein
MKRAVMSAVDRRLDPKHDLDDAKLVSESAWHGENICLLADQGV